MQCMQARKELCVISTETPQTTTNQSQTLLPVDAQRLLLYEHGFGYVWETDSVGDASSFINLFRQRFADCFTRQ